MKLNERLSKAPWKEFMIGERILSIGFGCVLLTLTFTSSDILYNFIHRLEQAQLKNLLLAGAEAIFSTGFLLIGLPLLITSARKLFAIQAAIQSNSD